MHCGAIGLAVCLSGHRANADDSLVGRIDRGMDRAAAFLVSQQADDGSWRSDVYGALRDGYSLTPTVVTALLPVAPRRADAREAMRRGIAFLMNAVDEDGSVRMDDGRCAYPVYAAAAASWAVVLDEPTPRHFQAQRGWLDLIMSHRLGAQLGWTRDDFQFGGWGYAMTPPRKPDGDGPYPFEANVSATLFGLGAMHMAGMQHQAVHDDALVFLERCQNYSAHGVSNGAVGSRFDDGGFFFCPTDAARNKAGEAGVDAGGATRFRSYGSATADGLRALMLCGLPADDGRVIAARRWLERDFAVDCNPGDFAGDRAVLQNATYYYYAWSVAHAFGLLGVTEIATEHGAVDWRAALAKELLRRQDADGAWRNRFTDAREDDPLVATPLTMAALAICKRSIVESDSGSIRTGLRGHVPMRAMLR